MANKAYTLHNKLVEITLQSNNYLPQAIINAVGSDIDLPGISIENIPAGATINQAKIIVSSRTISNTFAGNNFINLGTIQAGFNGNWVQAFAFQGGEFFFSAVGVGPGDAIAGNGDVSSMVPANGQTMNFKFENISAAHGQLVLFDVQVILQILVQMP